LIAFYFWASSKKLTIGFLLKVCVLVSILILGFNLIGEIVGKSSDELGILVYAAAPLHAFDEIINTPELLQGYFLTFFPVQGVLGTIFGFSASNELPNIFTPLPTNVYSLYGVYFNDFGIIGLFVGLFLAGLFSGFVEGTYRATEAVVFRVFSALNLAILTLSIFYDYYTTSGVVWMAFILTPFFFVDVNKRGMLQPREWGGLANAVLGDNA
jgi:oligosaccharide repeat unit polymerase